MKVQAIHHLVGLLCAGEPLLEVLERSVCGCSPVTFGPSPYCVRAGGAYERSYILVKAKREVGADRGQNQGLAGEALDSTFVDICGSGRERNIKIRRHRASLQRASRISWKV